MHDGIPHHIVQWLARLDIVRPASWRTLLTIIDEAVRTGDVARLQIKDICELTGLCERTVKNAVGELIAAGIIVRVERVGAFVVPMLRSAGEPLRTGFTAKQRATVRRALREAGALLGVDPISITMPVSYCEQLCLDPGITFHFAYLSISHGHDRESARRFVGLVLEFRYSEVVDGTPVRAQDLTRNESIRSVWNH